MDLTAKYRQMLGALPPHSPAWNADTLLLAGLALSLAAAHKPMLEIDPRSVTRLIDRYENIRGQV